MERRKRRGEGHTPLAEVTFPNHRLLETGLSLLPGAAVTHGHKLQAQMYPLAVLEAGSLKSRCGQGHALSKAPRRDRVHGLLQAPWCPVL